MGRDNVLDCVGIFEDVLVAYGAIVGEHEEGVEIADFSQGSAGEEALVLRVERGKVYEGGLEIGGWADVLAVSVIL